VQSVLVSQEFRVNRDRVKCLNWVINMVILNFLSFNFLQQPEVRSMMSVMGNGNSDTTVPYALLNPSRVRHYIIEVYSAVKGIMQAAIAKHATSKSIPYVSFTVDKVKSKVSGDSFLGIRIFFLDGIGEFRTFNLSIKQFRPSSELNHQQASVLLRTWLDYSLREFGIDRDRHISK
jgi:hypothetical protein